MSVAQTFDRIDANAELRGAAYDKPVMPQPIRVCYLIDQLRTGGTETQLLSLIKHVDRSRVSPFLCLLDGGDRASQALEPEDCPVIRCGVRSLLRPRSLLKARRLASQLRAWKIDVLQVHFPDSTYFGVLSAWLAGTRRVVRTRRDLFYWVTPAHRRWGRRLDGFCNRFLVDAMVVNSEAVRAKAVEDERPTARNITVIPNGLDLAGYVRLRYESKPTERTRDRRVRVGMIAMLRPEKRIDLFIQAAQQLVAQRPNVCFEIAGDGPERRRLENHIDQSRLGDFVLLRGKVDDVPAFLARLDVAVLCSDTEGCSNALIEYMAAGLPVVATAVGGNKELIDHGRTGLLTPPGDATALADAISELVASPRKVHQLGLAAQRYAHEHFEITTVAKRYAEFYEALVRSGDR